MPAWQVSRRPYVSSPMLEQRLSLGTTTDPQAAVDLLAAALASDGRPEASEAPVPTVAQVEEDHVIELTVGQDVYAIEQIRTAQ